MWQPKIMRRPIRKTCYKDVYIYEGDYEFLKSRKIPISYAIREALEEYVKKRRSMEEGRPALHVMSKVERDRWILSAPDDFIKPVIRMEHASSVEEIPREPVPDMSTWTKEERDEWIITGTVPRTRIKPAMTAAQA